MIKNFDFFKIVSYQEVEMVDLFLLFLSWDQPSFWKLMTIVYAANLHDNVMR